MARRAFLVVALAAVVVGMLLMKARLRQSAEVRAPGTAEGAAAAVDLLSGSKFPDALDSGRPTMADFGAGWCEACKRMEPVLHESAKRLKGKANIVFVDTDDYPSLAKHYKISLIPTQIFFDAKGEERGRHTGYLPIEEVAAELAAVGVK